MARASIPTLLSLDEWAAILGISPWEFNGCLYPAPKSAQCHDAFAQFQWQHDHLSREEVAQAISDAENMVAEYLLYWPAPSYFVDEVIPYPRPYQRAAYGGAGTVRGEWKSVNTKWHKVIKGGLFARTFIGNITGGNITASDLDGDSVLETFTATITNAAIGNITDANEIALYFATANRHGESISETWRIRPVTVSISGTTATIKGHRTLLINPAPEYAVNPEPLDANDASNYVTTVECYRVYTDDTATESNPYQGVAIWKDFPECVQNCTFSIKELCIGEQLDNQGQVFVSFGHTNLWPFPFREPDRLQLNYVAGLPLVNGRMQQDMARIVAHLSTALLANERCGCDRTNRILAHWREPIVKFTDNSAKATSYADTTIPFPMTRGGLWAWNRVKMLKHIEVMLI